MIYAAFLRGINVGGNNIIPMKELKACFEEAGMEAVTTYIASGNVVFQDPTHTQESISPILEQAIESKFGLNVKVLVLNRQKYASILEAIPPHWANDKVQKSDVLFLWDGDDSPAVLDQLPTQPGVDTVLYTPGAVLWNVSRAHQLQSKMVVLVGSRLYRNMTVRNVNTARKIGLLMDIT